MLDLLNIIAFCSIAAIALIFAAHDIPRVIQWCRNRSRLVRECCNADCEWVGYTDRMCGSVGPLCPDCGEVTEPLGPPICADTGASKWPGDCWNVRCQLGGTCCRASCEEDKNA